MAHTVEELPPRTVLRHGMEGKIAKLDTYQRYAISIEGHNAFLELHLGENNTAEAILDAVNSQRLLAFGTLEQDLSKLCERKPHLIMTMGPFVAPQGGLPTPRMLNRNGKQVQVPPGNLETWIGFRCVPCIEGNDLPVPDGSRGTDHTIICPRSIVKTNPVITLQKGLSDAIKKWLGQKLS